MDDQNYINLNNKKPRNKWKAVGMIFIILTLLFGGAGGFLGYALMQKKNDLDSANKNLKDVKAQLATAKTDLANAKKQNSTEESTNNSANYLTVKEWGIKFTIPDGLTGLKYTISNDNLEFNTDKVAAYGGICATDGVVGIIHRSNVSNEQQPGEGNQLNVAAINGYYFYLASPQASCTTDTTGAQLQLDTFQLIKQLADTIQKS
ncbi:hypothetical protein FWF48_03755 [Candidatus Saccharibacteria bacterium]|nr:hypothetical protein [Candidatus Saccharibacteria bacterium]